MDSIVVTIILNVQCMNNINNFVCTNVEIHMYKQCGITTVCECTWHRLVRLSAFQRVGKTCWNITVGTVPLN